MSSIDSEVIKMQVFMDLGALFPPKVLFKHPEQILQVVVPLLKGPDQEFVEIGLDLLHSIVTSISPSSP